MAARRVASSLILCLLALLFSPVLLALAGDGQKAPIIVPGNPIDPLPESPDGKRQVKLDGDGVVLLDKATGKAIRGAMTHDAPPINLKKKMTVLCWAFSPDGKYLATGAGYKTRDGDNEGQVCVWDLATGRRVAEFSKRLGSVQAVAFSRDGQSVVYRAEKWSIDGP